MNFRKDIIKKEWTLSTGGVEEELSDIKYNPDFFAIPLGKGVDEEKIKFIMIHTLENIYNQKQLKQQIEDFITFFWKNFPKRFYCRSDPKHLSKLLVLEYLSLEFIIKESHFLEFNNIDRYESSIIKELEKKIGLPIWVENEANMSILAEAIIEVNIKFLQILLL